MLKIIGTGLACSQTVVQTNGTSCLMYEHTMGKRFSVTWDKSPISSKIVAIHLFQINMSLTASKFLVFGLNPCAVTWPRYSISLHNTFLRV